MAIQRRPKIIDLIGTETETCYPIGFQGHEKGVCAMRHFCKHTTKYDVPLTGKLLQSRIIVLNHHRVFPPLLYPSYKALRFQK